MRTVRDILREKGTAVYSILPDATVYDALKMMADRNVGALIVLDGDRMVGKISERNYARRVILKHKLSTETAVREIMNVDVVTVTQNTNLEKCMELITEYRVRHLPVVEKDRVVGIISIGDIIKGIIGHKENIIAQLEGYIKGWR
jgi:CBS domain-containing protein